MVEVNVTDLFLASNSPRRRSLLRGMGVEFTAVDAQIDEAPKRGEDVRTQVERLAREKALKGYDIVMRRHDRARPLNVLAADTLVIVDNQVLGKPADRDQGLAMLETLSGRTHEVLTAVCLINRHSTLARLSQNRVTFKPLTRSEMERYWETGEPLDKAGGYGIQGLAAGFVRHLEGSFSGVMGLPLFETRELLIEVGIDWL